MDNVSIADGRSYPPGFTTAAKAVLPLSVCSNTTFNGWQVPLGINPHFVGSYQPMIINRVLLIIGAISVLVFTGTRYLSQ